MCGRLFQRFQHGIKGMTGEHVNFVNHVHLKACIRGRIHSLLEQLGHLIHTAIGSSIHLDVVDKAAGIDGNAGIAHTARMGCDVAVAVCALTIQGFGKYARKGRLADAAGACKQIGVVQPLLFQRMCQGAHDVLLPDQRVKIFGTVFSGENLIGHSRQECRVRPAFYLRRCPTRLSLWAADFSFTP